MPVRSVTVAIGTNPVALPLNGYRGFRLRPDVSNVSATFPVVVRYAGAEQVVWPYEWTALKEQADAALAVAVGAGGVYQLDLSVERDDLVIPLAPSSDTSIRVVVEVLATYGPGSAIPQVAIPQGSYPCVSNPVPGARSVELFALTVGPSGTGINGVNVRAQAEDVDLGPLEICGGGTQLVDPQNPNGAWSLGGLTRVAVLGASSTGFAWADASLGAPSRVRVRPYWFNGVATVPAGVTVTWFRRITYGG